MLFFFYLALAITGCVVINRSEPAPIPILELGTYDSVPCPPSLGGPDVQCYFDGCNYSNGTVSTLAYCPPKEPKK